MAIQRLALLALAVVAAGCVTDPYGHARFVGYDRDDATWEVVRNDPCRYEEYRRFADDHKNPEKRRRFAEQLARDGCKQERHEQRRYGNPYDQ